MHVHKLSRISTYHSIGFNVVDADTDLCPVRDNKIRRRPSLATTSHHMNLVVASFVRAVRHCLMHSASERTMLNRNDCRQLPSLSLFSFALHVFVFARIRDRQLIDVPDAVQIYFAAEIYECVKVPYTHRIQNISERIYSRCCSAGHCPMSSSNRIRMPLWLRYACYPCVCIVYAEVVICRMMMMLIGCVLCYGCLKNKLL